MSQAMDLVVPGTFEVADDGDTATLIGDRCLECGRVQFPSRPACHACSSRRLEPARLGPHGILWSSSIDRLGMLFDTPYAVAQVAMENGPVVQGYLEADFDELPVPGTPMVAIPRVLPGSEDRPPMLGYGFRVGETDDA
jgi:uncharacterized OB-fold protein